MTKTRLITVLLAVLALLLAGVWYLSENRNTQDAGAQGEVLIGGPFRLVDESGKTVTDEDFRGKFMLVYFGYTYCPDVCPTELQNMTAAMADLGSKASQVVPVFITVDPERDTVQVMSDYVKHFMPGLVGLTGTPEQVASVAKTYRVFFQKVTDEGATGGYSMDHSSIVYLMGPDGRFVEHFGPGTTPQQMAEGIRKYL